jgi:transcriptional regulator with XRE-family HTH domain
VSSVNRTDIAKRFGQVLRSARTKLDLSQEELAFEANLDRTYISMLERGTRVPTVVTLLQLAPALKMRASELVALLE